MITRFELQQLGKEIDELGKQSSIEAKIRRKELNALAMIMLKQWNSENWPPLILKNTRIRYALIHAGFSTWEDVVKTYHEHGIDYFKFIRNLGPKRLDIILANINWKYLDQ